MTLELDYQQGLQQLRKMVRGQIPEQQTEFAILEFRLLENLQQSRYGESTNHTFERIQILDSLNRFTDEYFSLQFIDLCQPLTSAVKKSGQGRGEPEQNNQYISSPPSQEWQGGTEMHIKGATYILHEPIISVRPSDRSVLYQRARGQEVGTNRLVWLKQLQIQHASQGAASWKTALGKEERLLNVLEQEHYHEFPRSLVFESTTTTTTLIHTASQGKTWAQSFQLPEQPLDAHLSRMLLRSALSVCTMLRILHQKHFSHRMLSPEHILYAKGAAYLQDVGRATWKYQPGEGVELYRAPEQRIANRHLAVPGTHTDIYQLGMILYHCLTGHVPASSQQSLPLRTWNETLSPEVDSVIQRAIAFNIKERWITISDFATALKRALTCS